MKSMIFVQMKQKQFRCNKKGKESRGLLPGNSQEALLQRKIPKKVSTIVTMYPDIGERMEHLIKKQRVGANQWRRTGVFTFASNKNTTGPKVT